uniref:Uncharacterized protein n=1 Tax=Romanomermis culicivorax TaxID=13658 RepID=A0A915HWJ8_ROMCU
MSSTFLCLSSVKSAKFRNLLLCFACSKVALNRKQRFLHDGYLALSTKFRNFDLDSLSGLVLSITTDFPRLSESSAILRHFWLAPGCVTDVKRIIFIRLNVENRSSTAYKVCCDDMIEI